MAGPVLGGRDSSVSPRALLPAFTPGIAITKRTKRLRETGIFLNKGAMKARPEGGRISIQLTTYGELCTMKLYRGRELASSLAFIPQCFLPPDLDKVQLLPRAAWKQTTVHLPLKYNMEDCKLHTEGTAQNIMMYAGRWGAAKITVSIFNLAVESL
ncbi:hypothetical protein Anapl_00058 [Anas platyrhynchos]|uniref:Uncharacterized protein n=1 Tax=Anas platyrhynchos TaxID=8839 RepID=R0LTX9_ANAPL|nr:hypothetical protein Anapl_00058 [Anas platyrhynchos]